MQEISVVIKMCSKWNCGLTESSTTGKLNGK